MIDDQAIHSFGMHGFRERFVATHKHWNSQISKQNQQREKQKRKKTWKNAISHAFVDVECVSFLSRIAVIRSDNLIFSDRWDVRWMYWRMSTTMTMTWCGNRILCSFVCWCVFLFLFWFWFGKRRRKTKYMLQVQQNKMWYGAASVLSRACIQRFVFVFCFYSKSQLSLWVLSYSH